MDWLKNYIIRTRWGDQASPADYFLARSMTVWEVWTSSFMTPKTPRIIHSRSIRRR